MQGNARKIARVNFSDPNKGPSGAKAKMNAPVRISGHTGKAIDAPVW
jgi:hypothetical protein